MIRKLSCISCFWLCEVWGTSFIDGCLLFFNFPDVSITVTVAVCSCNIYEWCLLYAFAMQHKRPGCTIEVLACTFYLTVWLAMSCYFLSIQAVVSRKFAFLFFFCMLGFASWSITFQASSMMLFTFILTVIAHKHSASVLVEVTSFGTSYCSFW